MDPTSKAPRIALVTYAMYCGGMEAFLLRLGRHLRDQGCEVEAITTIEPGEWFGRWAELQIKAEHIEGQNSLLPPVLHSRRVLKRLKAGNYDVVLLNHAHHAQATLARLPEHVIAIPILHNDNPEIYKVGCGNASAWNVAVAVSPKVAEVARQTVPDRPVVEITSGVDLPGPAVTNRWQDFLRRLRLIFIGRLEHSQKGVLLLPDILRSCLQRGVNAELTVVGEGPDAEALQRRIEAFGLSHNTRYLRGLVPERVYELLLDAHVLLMPSHFEGLPIALLESQACGCVPVASRLPGITDAAVADGVSGFLVPMDDADAFAEAVASLWRDPARWRRMSEAASERARQRFSVAAMGGSYLRLFEETLSGHYPLPRPRSQQPALDLGVLGWRDFVPSRVRRLGRRGRSWLAGLSGSGRASVLP